MLGGGEGGGREGDGGRVEQVVCLELKLKLQRVYEIILIGFLFGQAATIVDDCGSVKDKIIISQKENIGSVVTRYVTIFKLT